ncbi:MAG: cytochrome P450 [Comamonadaceae bacterium]|nr:MAG: cytochrome P450 [Comamonadaceae bacterium]
MSALPVQAMARLLGVPAVDLDDTVSAVLAFVKGIAAGADSDTLAASDAAVVLLMGQGEASGLDSVRAANRIALMQQALDATAGLIGNAVLRLRTHPAADDLEGVFAEVTLRDPPVQNTRRFAAGPLVLGGMEIAAGDGLLLLVAAANHDPALVQRRGFTFGAGAHACPGEQIAMGIAVAGLQALQEREPLARTFGAHTGYRPLPNARIPVFSH